MNYWENEYGTSPTFMLKRNILKGSGFVPDLTKEQIKYFQDAENRIALPTEKW